MDQHQMRRRVDNRSMTIDRDIQSKFEVAVRELEQIVQTIPPQNMPSCIGELERLKIVASLRLHSMNLQSNSMAKPDEKLLDMNQVAEALNIPISRVRELSRRKDGFPIQHIGKYVRVKQSDLWQWVEALQKNGLDSRLDHRYTIKYERKRTQAPSGKNGNHSSGVR